MSEGHQDRALERTRWWDGDPTECFWLEPMRDGVTESVRNPPWSRDELIIALEFYLRHPTQIPGKLSHEIGALSAFLNRLAQQVGSGHGDTFRNRNGV